MPAKVMPRRVRHAAQRGIAAIEFALVCTLFLVIFMGIAGFGAAFVVKQTLAQAAQEGARAMLQASLVPSSTNPEDQPIAADALCQQAVRGAVDWLNRYREGQGLAPIDCVSVPAPCNSSATTCTVTVTYRDYRDHPLIPMLIPVGWFLGKDASGGNIDWLPQDLSARATVQMRSAGS